MFLQKRAHRVFRLLYYFVWVSKYRRKIFEVAPNVELMTHGEARPPVSTIPIRIGYFTYSDFILIGSSYRMALAKSPTPDS